MTQDQRSGKNAIAAALGAKATVHAGPVNGKRVLGRTLLPTDSFRLRKMTALKTENVTSTSTSSKSLASVGLDLFRRGLEFDGVQPCHVEARHPSITSRLNSIPENADDQMLPVMHSQCLVIIGAPVDDQGQPSEMLARRIHRAVELYWQMMKMYTEQQAHGCCYLIPTSCDGSEDGVIEAEAVRNALIAAGIPSHHIVMDCIASSLMDNAVLLASVLRHLAIHHVHVITSEYQMTRAQCVFNGTTDAMDDMKVVTAYHAVQDGPRQRTRVAAVEQTLLMKAQKELEEAQKRVRHHYRRSASSPA